MNKKVLAGIGAGTVAGAAALLFGGQALVSHAATKELDKAIEDVSEFVEIDYDKVETNFLTRKARVKDVVLSPVGSNDQFKADEFVLNKYEDTDSVPTHVDFEINGIQLDSEALGSDAEMFKALGYEEGLEMDFATEYQYNEKDQIISLKSFKLGADEVGDLDLNLKLSNVDLSEDVVASLPFSLLGMTFNDAQIVYKDASLLERMIETSAEENGVSVDEFKTEMISALKEDSDVASLLSEDQIKEIEKFIQNPKSFTISMVPDEPVPFGSLMGGAESPGVIAELLKVEFKAN